MPNKCLGSVRHFDIIFVTVWGYIKSFVVVLLGYTFEQEISVFIEVSYIIRKLKITFRFPNLSNRKTTKLPWFFFERLNLFPYESNLPLNFILLFSSHKLLPFLKKLFTPLIHTSNGKLYFSACSLYGFIIYLFSHDFSIINLFTYASFSGSSTSSTSSFLL